MHFALGFLIAYYVFILNSISQYSEVPKMESWIGKLMSVKANTKSSLR